jgi:DNA-binding transcriptional LysR family regulator
MVATKSPAAEAMRWDDVRLFLALMRARKLAPAARQLALDTSTASRRLVGLEQLLGRRLFDRSRQGLAPTQAAEALLPAAEEVEGGMLKVRNAVSGLEAFVEGTVRVTAPPGLADAFLAPRLGRLLARHPGLRIEIDASVQVADLTRREADVALRTVRPRSGDLVMTRLLSSRWVAVASPSRARSLGRLRRWSDAPWVGWDHSLSHIGPARWLAEAQVEPVLRSNSVGVQLAAVTSGLGVALMTEQYALAYPLAAVAYAPSLANSAAKWPVDELWLVGHSALREVPRVAAVWAFIAEELTSVGPADVAAAFERNARRGNPRR